MLSLCNKNDIGWGLVPLKRCGRLGQRDPSFVRSLCDRESVQIQRSTSSIVIDLLLYCSDSLFFSLSSSMQTKSSR